MGFVIFRKDMGTEVFLAVGSTVFGALADAWGFLEGAKDSDKGFRIFAARNYAKEIENNGHFQFSGTPDEATMGAFVLHPATDRLVKYFSLATRESPRSLHFYFNEGRGMYDIYPRG